MAALLQKIFTGRVPYAEWAGRRREGALLDTMRIDRALRSADVGIMWLLADLAREAVAYNPKAQGILGKGLLPLAAADHELVPAEDGLSPQERATAKDIANKIRAMVTGVRGFRQALLELAFGFFDGRAALEVQYERRGAETWPVALDWMIPQRLSFDEARRLIVVDRWGDYGLFRKRGPALDELPGKFIQFMPRMFGDLQEREGLAPRYLFWLLFDRIIWRHRLLLTEKFGLPWRLVEQEIEKAVGVLKLLQNRGDGGEGGAPNDDDAALDYTAGELDNLEEDGKWVALPGQKLRVEWPPAEVHDFFGQGSDQILDRLSWLTCHNGINEAPRAAEVVLKGPEDVLFEFRAQLVGEAVQRDFVNVLVELNYGADALPLAPRWQLRTRPERDKDKETDRLTKASALGPIGIGVLYEVTGYRPPNEGEAAITPPTQGGAPGGGTSSAPALPRDEGASSDAVGALRDLGEEDDESGQADAAEGERSLARWFAAEGRKVQPRSANGSPEVLVERGVREGARHTSRWADELADAADGTTETAIYNNLRRCAASLDVEGFARATERRLVHGAMLGGLDADYEMTHEAVIEPVHFVAPPIPVPGEPAASGIADFATMPFGEALKAFVGKKPITRRAFDRLTAAAKRKAFTVAGLARKDMLATAHDELSKALQDGDDLRAFSKRLAARFDAAGWTQLNPSHVENVFRTNVMGAYSAGRREQMTQPAVMAARPYWQILGVSDSRTRPTHKAAIGKVLPAGDPFFDRAGPPFGFQCRCRHVSRSAADMKRLGLVPTIGAQIRGLPDEGWDAGGSLL
jgi:SPP1 gp7 family putative phage head morphogenesis protein